MTEPSSVEARAAERLRASRLRLRIGQPFFATLSLFARYVFSDRIPAAATDGRQVFVNPEFVLALPPAQLDGVLLHEVLHAALRHVERRGSRDPLRWNLAADVVVNAIVEGDAHLPLPDEVYRRPELAHLSVEEVYELIDDEDLRIPDRFLRDVLEYALSGQDDASAAFELAGSDSWDEALRQAQVLQQARDGGSGKLLAQRVFEQAMRASVDWRTLLWRYLSRQQHDYEGFDRRFVGRGIYLESLQARDVEIAVAVDTSGSVSRSLLGRFIAEVRAVASAYPRTTIRLYYCDAGVDGPHMLFDGTSVPPAHGGGGTSFRPFFGELERHDRLALAVYLTDGFGEFPELSPRFPVLWVVSPGGRADGDFPFGRVVRMLEHDENRASAAGMS